MSARYFKNQKGFTLIELLVVIGILAILLSIVLIAINPARQFGQANNTRRHSDVTAILNAVGAYAADHKGVLPNNIPTGAYPAAALPIKPGAGGADICADLVTNYMPALPQDPQTGAGTSITDCTGNTGEYTNAIGTGYVIVKDAAGRVTVGAPGAENGETISNTR